MQTWDEVDTEAKLHMAIPAAEAGLIDADDETIAKAKAFGLLSLLAEEKNKLESALAEVILDVGTVRSESIRHIATLKNNILPDEPEAGLTSS